VCALDLHKVLLQDLMEEGEKEEVDKKFIVRGRKVLVDEWIGNPLPPIEPKDQMSSHVSYFPSLSLSLLTSACAHVMRRVFRCWNWRSTHLQNPLKPSSND